MGLTCEASAFLPFLTNVFVPSADGATNGAVPCTIKSFPYLPAHCLQYARGEFDFEFSVVPSQKTLSCMLQDRKAPDHLDNYLLAMERIALSLLHVTTFEQCVAWARQLYDEYLWKLEDTLLEHPQDEVDDHGVPFWSAPKRLPRHASHAFDWQNDECKAFVIAAAVLKAKTCGVPVPPAGEHGDIHVESQWLVARSRALFSQVSERRSIEIRRDNKLRQSGDKIAEHDKTAQDAEEARLVSVASSAPCDHQRIQPIMFNKEDPAHM
jgi:hypothetical protein